MIIISIVVAVVTLIVLLLSIRSCVISRGIRRDLARATELVALDTVEGHREALQIVDRLVEDYPEHSEVRARGAWHHLLYAMRVGPDEPHLTTARQLVEAAGDEAHPLLSSARAGLLIVDGDAEQAEAVTRAALEQATSCRECGYVRGEALRALGETNDAALQLDRARQGVPPFLPALAALAEVLRERGRHDEARTALVALAEAAPGHRDAAVQAILNEIEAADGSVAPEALGPLEAQLAAVKIDEAHTLRAAHRHYAAGRLELLKGDPASAVTSLTAAAKLRPRDQDVATWQARAFRRADEPTKALASLAPFPDEPGTEIELLRLRAEILLDLHRTVSAEPTIAALGARKASGAAQLEGVRLLRGGEPAAAVEKLDTARLKGQRRAALDLAEAQLLVGRADGARKVLGQVDGDDPIALCAEGFSQIIRGSTRRGRPKLLAATKAGDRCGASLAGRYLVGTGEDEALAKGLAAALEQREDLRDRVAFGRLKLRVTDAEAARRQLDRVRALEPEGALVLVDLVKAYQELGQKEVAVAVAREGMERSKNHPRLVALVARFAREADDLAQARKLVNGALESHPRSTPLQIENAANLLERRRWHRAQETAEEAMHNGPFYSEAACLWATIRTRRGSRRDAQLDLVRSLLRATSDSGFIETAEARVCLAENYGGRTRSIAKARTQLGIIRRRGLEWAEVYYLLGALAARKGRDGRAERNLRRALELDIAHRGAWAELADLGELNEEDLERFQRLWPGQRPGQ